MNFLASDDGGGRIVSFKQKEAGYWSTDLTDPDIYEGKSLYDFMFKDVLWEEEEDKIPEPFIRGGPE